jgi:hypothetical protein
MGYSTGRCDYDTLIVESIGCNDRTWLRGNGVPGTERLHITERIRRSDFGHMEVLTTYKDRLTMLADRLIAEETLEADAFEELFADIPDPRHEEGSSPTPIPLDGARPHRQAPAATDGAGPSVPSPKPSPSPA